MEASREAAMVGSQAEKEKALQANRKYSYPYMIITD